MSLPARLYPGQVAIYGTGSPSITGIVPPSEMFRFGLIDQIWDNMPGTVSVGESVLYNTEDIIAQLVYSNTIYVVIPEEKIILIEGNL